MPYKDKARQQEFQKQWVAKRRNEFFAGKCCVKCGSTESLELDHIDPSQKVDHRIWTWTLAKRLQEAAKCQILCRACHQIKSSAAYPRAHGASRYSEGCRCEVCREGQKLRAQKYRAKKKAVAR